MQLPIFEESILQSKVLRYGENPHQKGTYFGAEDTLPKQLHGKEISHNNLLDIEAAIELIADTFKVPKGIIVPFSAEKGTGREELVRIIFNSIE